MSPDAIRSQHLRALFACALLVLLTSAVWGGGVEVTGPIAGGTHGQPFSQPTFDLADHRYVSEEFFLAGRASAYEAVPGTELGEDGRWQTRKEQASVPYRTRILVVRPSDPSKFNGTVVVHWQNVTAGYELGAVAEGSEYLRGYAWVGVSAQAVGVHGFPGPEAAGLVQWDPERYGSLEHPGDAYSYDIYTQAARVVGPERAKGPVDPMGGLEVERLVAAGASQSAARLRTYIDGVHPVEKVFDGFIPYIDFASTIPFDADKSGEPRRRQRRPTRIREDLDVPVFVVNSETETQAYAPVRQPPTDKFRFWEVAGTSHVSVPRAAAATMAGLDHPNWLDYRPVYDAAVRHMHVWLTQGTPPPVLPPIEIDGTTVARDERGNAKGGIRLPALAVPTAEHSGLGRPVEGGNRFAFLYGHARDFTADELGELYPDRETFLARYDVALEQAIAAGFVLAEDGPVLRATAVGWAADHLKSR